MWRIELMSGGQWPRRVGGAFRHLILGVTKTRSGFGVTLGLHAIIGGQNRFGVSQKNLVVGSLSYGF